MKSTVKNNLKEGIKVFAALLAIVEFFNMRLPKVQWLQFLSKKVVEINVLRLILIVFLVIILHQVIPSYCNRIRNKKRAERFKSTWNYFKDILIEYSNSGDTSLQGRYFELRECLEKEIGYFRPTILNVESLSHRTKFLDEILKNFEQCFSIRDISKWSEKVKRRIPEELDCFDYLLNALVGYFEAKK